jgi:ankyrin repeat protein
MVEQTLLSAHGKRSALRLTFSQISAQQLSFIFFYSARFGDYKTLMAITKSQLLNVNMLDDLGRTAIMYAAIGNHVSCIKHLHSCGGLVTVMDMNGCTALHYSAYYGQYKASQTLMKLSMTLETVDHDGKLPAHYAVQPESTDVLHLIMSAQGGRHLNALDSENRTPLMWAAYLGNAAALLALLRLGANAELVDKERRTALHWAISNTHSQCCAHLIRHCPSLLTAKDKQGRTSLHAACAEGNITLVHYLLRVGASMYESDNLKRVPLHWAAGKTTCWFIL